MSIKSQIIKSVDRYILAEKEIYNGIIPLNEIIYTIEGEDYIYESPYSSNLYWDKVCWFHFRDNYFKTKVRELSEKDYERMITGKCGKLHGNSAVLVIN